MLNMLEFPFNVVNLIFSAKVVFFLNFLYLFGEFVTAEQAIATVNTYADLQCIFNASEFGVLSTVLWQKGGHIILRQEWSKLEKRKENRYISTISYEKTSASLQIRNVQFEDAGNYTCSAYPSSGLPVSTMWNLQIQGYPCVTSTKTVFTENDTTTLKCCVDFALLPHGSSFVWSFTGASDLSKSEKFTKQTFENGRHTICSHFPIKVNRNDHQAVLECLINNELNATSSFEFYVRYPPTTEIYPDSFLKFQNSFWVNMGDDANITCVSKGNPKPVVSLEKEIQSEHGREWVNETNVSVIKSSGTGMLVTSFLLQNFSIENTGTFRCKASNGIGSGTAESRLISLEITDPVTVKIVKLDKGESGRQYGKINISCVSEGNPTPIVTLQKLVNKNDWVTLPEVPVIANGIYTSNVTFVLSTSDHDVYGTYRCFASNVVGSNATSDQTTIEMSVSLSFFLDVLLTNYIPITVSVVSIFLILVLVIVIRKTLKGICCYVYNVSTDTKGEPTNQRMSALDEFWRGLSYEYDLTPNDERGTTSANLSGAGLHTSRTNNYVNTEIIS